MSDEILTNSSSSRKACIDQALEFYREHILEPVLNKAKIRQKLGFMGDVQIHSSDWEVFGALLIGTNASGQRYGHDLEAAEIKSAKIGGSFEYQYHKKHGTQKLDAEAGINHVFISYSGNYKDVDVHLCSGQQLSSFWSNWASSLETNYQNGKQRFRKSIPRGEVESKGKCILRIRDGKVAWTDPRSFDDILAET